MTPRIATDFRFVFGNPKVPQVGEHGCCGKPVGCNQTHGDCQYLRHPWKRAMVFGDPDVRCQCKWAPDAHTPGTTSLTFVQCILRNGHAGACEPPEGGAV